MAQVSISLNAVCADATEYHNLLAYLQARHDNPGDVVSWTEDEANLALNDVTTITFPFDVPAPPDAPVTPPPDPAPSS